MVVINAYPILSLKLYVLTTLRFSTSCTIVVCVERKYWALPKALLKGSNLRLNVLSLYTIKSEWKIFIFYALVSIILTVGVTACAYSKILIYYKGYKI